MNLILLSLVLVAIGSFGIFYQRSLLAKVFAGDWQDNYYWWENVTSSKLQLRGSSTPPSAIMLCEDYNGEDNMMCAHVLRADEGPEREERCNIMSLSSKNETQNKLVKHLCPKSCGLCDIGAEVILHATETTINHSSFRADLNVGTNAAVTAAYNIGEEITNRVTAGLGAFEARFHEMEARIAEMEGKVANSVMLPPIIGNARTRDYENKEGKILPSDDDPPPRRRSSQPSYPSTDINTTSQEAHHEEFWEKEDAKCIHIDNVCSWKDTWFYALESDLISDGNLSTPHHHNQHYHQPSIKLNLRRLDLDHLDRNAVVVDDRVQFNVSPASSHGMYNERICSFSDTTNHLVIQSAFNDMMLEFYVRAFLPLHRWMREAKSSDDVQIYVHFVEPRRLYEGHKLYLGALPSNRIFESFVTLMPKKDTCQCHRKLIFCGYNVQQHQEDAVDAAKSLGDTDENSISSITIKPTEELSYPSLRLDPYSCQQNEVCANKFRGLRNDLIDTFNKQHPDLDDIVSQYRRHILIEKGIIANNNTLSTQDVDEWTFVGLAHRKWRRVWLNIDDALRICDQKYRRNKVVCIKIDVEEAKAKEQLLKHRSLHAFIGVHGKQREFLHKTCIFSCSFG